MIICSLASFDEFSEDIQNVFKWFLWIKEYINPQRAKGLINTKGELTIYVTIPKLVSLRIRGEAKTFGLIATMI